MNLLFYKNKKDSHTPYKKGRGCLTRGTTLIEEYALPLKRITVRPFFATSLFAKKARGGNSPLSLFRFPPTIGSLLQGDKTLLNPVITF